MKKLFVISFIILLAINASAQFRSSAAVPITPGTIGPSSDIYVMDFDNEILLENEVLGTTDPNYGVSFFCWQRSWNGINWEIVSEFPDQSQPWPGNFPYGGLPNQENMVYYNPEYIVPYSDMTNGTYSMAYYRRVCWDGASNYQAGSDYFGDFSNIITVRFWNNMDAGTIGPSTQNIADGSPGTIHSSVNATMNSGGYGPISYFWQSSDDGNTWEDETSFPTSWPNNMQAYSPAVEKGSKYYRRVAICSDWRDRNHAGYSNTVQVHFVGITSAGTIRQEAVSCDIRYIHLVEDTPIVYTGDGSISSDYIHGYELSYNGGTTWESHGLAPDQAFDMIIPFGDAFLIRRWVQDPFDQIAGERQYSNTISVVASAPGSIVNTSANLCQNNGNPINVSSSSAGSYLGRSVSYQWTVSTNNSVFTDIPGATGASLTNYQHPSYQPNLFFKRKMHLTGCSDFYSLESNTIEINIPGELDGGVLSTTRNQYCYDEYMDDITVLDNNGSRTVSYVWTARPHDGSEDWDVLSNIVNDLNGSTHDLDLKRLRMAFWDWAENNGGVDFRRTAYEIGSYTRCESNSANIITVDRFDDISAGVIGEDEIICSSDELIDVPNVEQTSAATGGDGGYVYSWEYQNQGENTWNEISGATSASLSFASLPTNTRTYRRKDHDACLTDDYAEYTNEVIYTYRDLNIDGMIDSLVGCEGTLQTATADPGYISYAWNLNSTVFSSGGQSYSRTLQLSDESLALRVTDADQCEAETEVSITTNQLPSFSMPDVHICEGQSENIIAPFGYSVYSFDGGLAQSENQIVLSHADAVSSSSRRVAVVDSNGCESGDIAYSAFPENLPVVSLSDDYVCEGQSKSISISASPGITNITWEDITNSVVVASGPTQYSITVSPTATTQYRVTVENQYCSNSATMTMTVRDNPSIALRDTFACYNDNLILSAEDAYPNHYWSTNNGFQSATTQITVRNSLTVSLRVVDAYNCETTESMAITMQPLPNVSVATVQGCEGDFVTLSAPSGYAYLWETGETTQAIQREVMAFGHPENEVDLTVTDMWGCIGTTTGSIYTLPNPSPPSITTQNICDGQEHIIAAGRTYETYEWSTGETTQSITVNYSENQSMFLRVGNQFGCYDTTIFDVIVHDVPQFDIADTSKCNDGSFLVVNAPLTGPAYDYYWSNGSMNSAANFSITSNSELWLEITEGICTHRDTFFVQSHAVPTVSLPDMNVCVGDSLVYSYADGYSSYSWSNGQTDRTLRTVINSNEIFTLTVEDANGCVGSDNMNVTRMFLPTVYISGDNSVCIGNSIDLSVPASFPSILWSTGETTPTISHLLTEDTDFSLTVTDVNGCVNSDYTSIITYDNPVGQLSDTAVCDGDYAILSHPGNYQLEWSTGATGNNILFRPTNDVRVYLTLTDASGCVGTDSMQIDVIDIPNISIPNESVCEGDSVLLVSPQSFANMLWSTGDTTQSTYVTPISNPELVTFTYSDIHGCGSSTNVLVNRLSVAPFSVQPQAICNRESTALSAQIGFASYLWSTGETTPTIVVSPTETTFYSVDVVDNNGCSAHKETFVEVNDLPQFELTDQYICPNNSVTFAGPVGNYNYLWSNGSTSRYLTVQHNAAGDFELTVTDRASSCADTKGVTAHAVEEPEIFFEDSTICTGQSITYNLPEHYQFIWWDGQSTPNRTIQPLQNTDYIVGIVDSFNCTTSQSFYVTVLTAPLLEVDDVVLCGPNNVSVSVPLVSGFDYTWSNGETVNAAIYVVDEDITGWVTAENVSCRVSDTFEISIEQIPDLTFEDVVICTTDSVLVSAPEGFEYIWSTGETSRDIYLSSIDVGIIDLTLTTENDCESSYSFEASHEAMELSIAADSTEILVNTDLNISASIDGGTDVSFSWLIGENDYSGSSIVFNTADFGSYDLWILAESINGCVREVTLPEFITVVKADTSGSGGGGGSVTTEFASAKSMNVHIYPNPVSDKLNIDTREYDFDNEMKVAILDLTGREVYRDELIPGTLNSIDFTTFKDGIYIMLLDINGFTQTTKLIKEK